MSQMSDDKPLDFDGYWRGTLENLAKFPPAPEVDEMPLRSTDFATAYGVNLTSIGPYRIFGYLSVPRGSGPFPARYYLPPYGSVADPIPQGSTNAQRREYVTFSICARGQRHADQPFSASFPGLLTQDISDPGAYIFRGIVADCCRGLEYLVGRPEVDRERLVAIGSDLALVTAALYPKATHVVCTPALFYAAGELAPRTQEYPLEELNDYLRLYPSRRERVHRTLSHFDLRWFAPRVNAATLLIAGADGELLDAEILDPLVQSLSADVDLYRTQHSSYKDNVYIEEWVTQQFGLAAPILPPHWQT